MDGDCSADSECAFCGRSVATAHRVFCVDCQVPHATCPGCIEEVADDPEAYRLVA